MIKVLINRLLFKLKNSTSTLGRGGVVSRKAIVGKNCKISSNCKIGPNVKLGDYVKVGEGIRLENIVIGDHTMLEAGVTIVGSKRGRITIGKECYIGINNILDSSNEIFIGDFVHIAGPSTGIWCHSSVKMTQQSIPLKEINNEKHRPTSPVRIENNVYIGGNCTIYPGITIQHHSVIAPNSAVTKDVESNILIGGVPAKKIKKFNN